MKKVILTSVVSLSLQHDVAPEPFIVGETEVPGENLTCPAR